MRTYVTPQPRLTMRDEALLYWVGQAGVVSLDQAARWQWQGQPDAARKCLSRLRAAGYLRTHFTNVRWPGEQIYSLTAQGRQQFAPEERTDLAVGLPRASLLLQQLRLQEVYLWLTALATAEGSTITRWQTEHSLQRQMRQTMPSPGNLPTEIPDGRVNVLAATGQRAVIDIEIDGHYHGTVLHTKAAIYGRQNQSVLWVCPARRVRPIQAAIQPYPHLHLIILEDTPDARPHPLSTDPAGIADWL